MVVVVVVVECEDAGGGGGGGGGGRAGGGGQPPHCHNPALQPPQQRAIVLPQPGGAAHFQGVNILRGAPHPVLAAPILATRVLSKPVRGHPQQAPRGYDGGHDGLYLVAVLITAGQLGHILKGEKHGECQGRKRPGKGRKVCAQGAVHAL